VFIPERGGNALRTIASLQIFFFRDVLSQKVQFVVESAGNEGQSDCKSGCPVHRFLISEDRVLIQSEINRPRISELPPSPLRVSPKCFSRRPSGNEVINDVNIGKSQLVLFVFLCFPRFVEISAQPLLRTFDRISSNVQIRIMFVLHWFILLHSVVHSDHRIKLRFANLIKMTRTWRWNEYETILTLQNCWWKMTKWQNDWWMIDEWEDDRWILKKFVFSMNRTFSIHHFIFIFIFRFAFIFIFIFRFRFATYSKNDRVSFLEKINLTIILIMIMIIILMELLSWWESSWWW
jgi:hypothetical protein